jgi:2-polyprenyl-3-methyl-5-hydroxy-6-metoxy-1,4-benzoquinol methylase
MKFKDFRGKEEDVAAIQKKYLEYFREAGRVLDLGCGQGTFLELLSGGGKEAYGIDSDPEKTQKCLKKGLKAECSGIFEFFEKNDRQFDGIFVSHLVEHLLPQQTRRLFQNCHQQLTKRGVLVVITPNIGNLHVATETFHLDLTHIRPYPLKLLVALFEEAGFSVIASGEDPETATDFGSSKLKRLMTRKLICRLLPATFRNAVFSGEDVFVVGRKS